jgi:hypothetical protein
MQSQRNARDLSAASSSEEVGRHRPITGGLQLGEPVSVFQTTGRLPSNDNAGLAMARPALDGSLRFSLVIAGWPQ